jgi:cytochrome oxidase Cu insertion factor (SCO1/SenC/PrrC family)
MSRRVTVACAIGAALVLGVVAALATSFGDGSPAPSRDASIAGSGPYRGSEVPGGITMRDFSLRNYDGRSVRSSDLAGRVTLLTFLDSQCTESCPVIAWTVARTIDALTPAERRGVRAVAISTDPAEDTKRSVYSFLEGNHALGRLLYLGGGEPERELRRVWDDFDVLSSLESGEDTLHSAPVRIYDRSGEWVTTLHAGADLTEANLVHDIRVALDR